MDKTRKIIQVTTTIRTIAISTIFALTALTVTLSTGCSEQKESTVRPEKAVEKKVTSDVVLQVGERTINIKEFQQAFARTQSKNQSLSDEEVQQMERSFLHQLLDRELTLAEGDRLQISVTTEEHLLAYQDIVQEYSEEELKDLFTANSTTEALFKKDLHDRMMVDKVVAAVVEPRIVLSDEEITVYYEEHLTDYDRPDEVRARQIVVTTEEEGKKIQGLLRKGDAFEDLARRHSNSPDSEDGGDLGFFARGQMPAEFDQVVFSLPINRISKLIKSDYGYHIFRVEEHRPARKLTLEHVREEIIETLKRNKKADAYRSWLHDVSSRTTIEVNWSLL